MSQGNKIVIVDYKKGNLASVKHGFTQAHFEADITSDPEVIAHASALVLPGVGSFADAIAYMNKSGQTQAIKEAIHNGVPFLGICLGLQLLFERGDEVAVNAGIPEDVAQADKPAAAEPAAAPSAETWVDGLGILPGYCSKLKAEGEKIPHVGWNSIIMQEGASHNPLYQGIPDGSYFYFTHSYVAYPEDMACVLTKTQHGPTYFPSSVSQGNVFGVQFHPEKSSHMGMKLLENFGALSLGRMQ